MEIASFSPSSPDSKDIGVWVGICAGSVVILSCAFRCLKWLCCRATQERTPLLENHLIVEINDERKESTDTPFHLRSRTESREK